MAEHEVREGVSVITAFVVKREDAELRPEDIAAFAERQLAAYKRPKAIFIVPTLPRSANGKLLRRELPGAIQALQTTP